jgi:hypothetical protein
MTTLQGIISSNSSLTQAQLKADRQLVIEIQTKLANLGFYPGGGWIDGDIGDLSSFSWTGLVDFCNAVGGISIPSTGVAIDLGIASKLLGTSQVISILDGASNAATILERLKKIQKASPIVNVIIKDDVPSAFVSRTINKSPFQTIIKNYPVSLEQVSDGINIFSYDDTTKFSNYPVRGSLPTSIDTNGLSFLSPEIENACVCIGAFTGNQFIEAHWVGKNEFNNEQFYSTTKFIGVLNTLCQLNKKSTLDIDDCTIKSPKHRFNDLVKDMVSYQEEISSSNAVAAMFKRFSTRKNLEKWVTEITKHQVNFRGFYGENPYIDNPRIEDSSNNSILLAPAPDSSGDNAVSAYDLVRLISMIGWHPHLPVTAQLPDAKWASLESIVKAMGYDTARYVDVALETLGLINVISEPVVFSKVGWGGDCMTYAAFVKFIDHTVNPSKLRTFALALRCPNNGSFDFCDTRLAAAVAEIIRRIVKEELI